MSWKPTNQPGHYDHERVARLQPIQHAILGLDLPLLRSRTLGGILNALEMQIEIGGDSPEVNCLLLQDLFQEGYELLEAKQQTAACDRWLEAWELVKQLTRPEMHTTGAFDQAYPGGYQLVFNWCQDLEIELGNAGLDKPVYHEHRLRYAREFLELFPEEDTDFQVNFRRAQGQALWQLGRRSEAETVYTALVDRFPDNAWGYIAWTDQLWLFRDSPKEYAKAEAILKRALARPAMGDRDVLLERLEDLYEQWGKPKEQAALAAQRKPPEAQPQATSRVQPSPAAAPPVEAPTPAARPARNAPCWCGSGKKYKRCHLTSDEAALRCR